MTVSPETPTSPIENLQDRIPVPTSPADNLQDRNDWIWGFTPQAELWNGRFAMLGFVAALLTEMISGQGILRFWGLM